MEIDIKDYRNVCEINPLISNGYYQISLLFKNGDIMSYAFNNKERFLDEYSECRFKLHNSL